MPAHGRGEDPVESRATRSGGGGKDAPSTLGLAAAETRTGPLALCSSSVRKGSPREGRIVAAMCKTSMLGIANQTQAPAEQTCSLSPTESLPPCFLLCFSSAIEVCVLHSRVLSFIKIWLNTLLFHEAEVDLGSVNDRYVCFYITENLLSIHTSHLAR